MDAAAQKRLGAGQPADFAAQGTGEVIEVVGPSVGERAFEVGPYPFVGIELGRVGGKGLEVKTGMTAAQFGQGPAAVDRSVVEQDNQGAAQMAQQMAQELADFFAADVRWVKLEVEAQAFAHRAHANAGDGRDPVMAVPVAVDGRLAAGRPGLAHAGDQLEPGFVNKDEMGAQPRGVFFIRGHCLRFQSSMALSLRSSARRSGFWWLQPNWCSKRPT